MNNWAGLAAILGMTGVVLGAFGAHGIKPHITPTAYEQYQTAVLYHFIHALILLIAALYMPDQSRFKAWALWAFLLGILFFSGSIYLIATREITGISSSILGPITPIGGVLFIIGWVLMAISFFQKNN